jgi:hypothetical protein
VENWFRLADAGAPGGKSMSVLLAMVESRIPVLTAGMAAAGAKAIFVAFESSGGGERL